MFTIYGGKTEFNQWEQGQRVTNPKLTVGNKVRFWNQSGETHPMIAYMHEGVVVADVPNDLLQHCSPLLVQLCGDPECLTRFIVNAQKKPDDYVFIDNTHCEYAHSSGGGVTSWNDLTDKPFGKEIKEILPETTATVDPERESAFFPNIVDVTAGNTYTVRYNGTNYTCTAQPFSLEGVTAIALGDLGLMTGGVSTGEPFVMMCFDATLAAGMGAGVAVQPLDGSASVTLSIVGEVVNRIDPVYLPKVSDLSDGWIADLKTALGIG